MRTFCVVCWLLICLMLLTCGHLSVYPFSTLGFHLVSTICELLCFLLSSLSLIRRMTFIWSIQCLNDIYVVDMFYVFDSFLNCCMIMTSLLAIIPYYSYFLIPKMTLKPLKLSNSFIINPTFKCSYFLALTMFLAVITHIWP